MEREIKFRLLQDQLTDNEFKIFVMNVIKSFSRKFIVSALFEYFKSNKNKNNYLNDTIILISNILKSRKNKKSQPKSNCIHKLPSQLIGNTSSFLNLNHIHNLKNATDQFILDVIPRINYK